MINSRRSPASPRHHSSSQALMMISGPIGAGSPLVMGEMRRDHVPDISKIG